jgi:hypothetical protein
MTAPRTVDAAGITLVLPEGCVARLQSRADGAEAVAAFVASSPDATTYHQPAWMAFARSIRGHADLVLVERDGAALFALPVHPEGRTIAIGNSGVLFPSGPRETTHKRSARALADLVQANPRLGWQGLQSLQAPAYDDAERTALLALLLEEAGVAGHPWWSRALTWSAHDPAPGTDDDPLDHLSDYDAKLRNQIRQGGRHGLTVSYALPRDRGEAAEVYREFTDLHRESWARTGLRPHGLGYWLDLNAAVTSSGSRDLVVMARGDDGQLVAAVTCHLRGSRAIYWAGASRPTGLEARANPFSLHAAITRARALGVTTFELGRFSTSEPSEKERSVTRYKAQFGGRVVRLTTLATPTSRGEWVAHQAYRLRRRASVLRGREFLYV